MVHRARLAGPGAADRHLPVSLPAPIRRKRTCAFGSPPASRVDMGMATRPSNSNAAGAMLLAVCTALFCNLGEALAEDTTTTPYPGVTHIRRVTSTQRIRVVKINLGLKTIR